MVEDRKIDIFALLICFAFIPVYVIEKAIGEMGYMGLMLIAIGVIVIQILRNEIHIRCSELFIFWMILMGWILVCSLLNSQNPVYSFYYIGKCAIWFFCNDYYLEKGDITLLKYSRNFMCVCVVATLMQQVLFPGVFGYAEISGNAYNVLASDNFLGYYYAALIAIMVVIDYIECERVGLFTYIMAALSLASVCVAWAVKNVIGIALILLYMFFVFRKKIASIITPKLLLIVYVIVFSGIVFFEAQSFFYTFFENYLGKSQTLMSRARITQEALNKISDSPFWGYGLSRGGRLKILDVGRKSLYASHNIILEIILEGGILGGLIYILSMIRTIFKKRLPMSEDDNYLYLFLAFNVFVFFVLEMFSWSIYFPYYYMPVVLIANMDRLVEIKNKNRYSYRLNL